MRDHRSVFASLTVACLAAALWGWGCSTSPGGNTSSTGTGGSAGSGGSMGTGGSDVTIDGGGNDAPDDAEACTSTSAEAHRVPLDIVFVIDRSGSMHYDGLWKGTTSALTEFFDDPASIGIGAGIVYFPSIKADSCEIQSYVDLDVPIGVLPGHSFALTNSMPADATGIGTPTWAALKGALLRATAYQDQHPTHKVVVVLATDGDPYLCGSATIYDIALAAKSARLYNGVLTYVIAVKGATLENLDQIAAAGGTGVSYDITSSISLFSAKMAEIRTAALGCDFEIPPPPNGQQLDPNKVNFSYTPKGVGSPKLLPRADDLADCKGQPGWYFDSNASPTRIVLCPSSCSTVQADSGAKVEALFGCKSLLK